MMLRPYEGSDAGAVDKLYAACHPTWPAKPPGWWWAHPTLVLEAAGQLIGATAFTITPPPAPELLTLAKRRGAEVGWGHGIYVDPAERGKGHGLTLAMQRHRALKALGIGFFFGMTQPGNAAMVAIFTKQGLTAGVTLPKQYPDHSNAVLYHGRIT